MERLTDNKLKTICDGYFVNFASNEEAVKYRMLAESAPKYEEIYRKLAEYEDKQEQELLLELPYPLGTEHIYFADENDMEVYKLDAEKIEVHMMPISKKIMYTIDCYEFFIEDFGKIVFLTESEAEEALEKMGGSHEDTD